MTTSALPFGTQIALNVRHSSEIGTSELVIPRTLDDLLRAWSKEPPRELPVLRTTCNLLAKYLDTPVEHVLLNKVKETRDGFRTFLEGRKNKETSIRTYVNHVRILLNYARASGWEFVEEHPEAWRGVVALAVEKKCDDLAKHLARFRRTPGEVLIEDVDQWVLLRTQQGHSYGRAKNVAFRLWHILRDCGYAGKLPTSLLREDNYGVPLDQLPSPLKGEVMELLDWKQVAVNFDRPVDQHHRPVTAQRLQFTLCGLYGYSKNIRHAHEINSLSQLIQKEIVGGYVAWCMNVREVKGQTLQRNLRLIPAALRHHPVHTSLDIAWFQPLMDRIPAEDESEVKQRKALKYLDYKAVEAIPDMIRADRVLAEKRGNADADWLVMEELMIKWLITLPWRQRNIREMRVGGSTPNLFRASIPPFSEIDKPDWVQQEEQKNPAAKFWQFHFGKEETKTGIEVTALLPRQLVGLLEEYLKEYRPRLVGAYDPGTLFLNRVGKPLTRNQTTALVSTLVLRRGGRRVTPHLFRDIVAYTWLKAHPKDYLTLSKMLWHSGPNMVIKTYGSRFNESSGVCAMEAWLDEREANQK